MSKRIVIIGAGPTGLGAALRLSELGYENWTLYERENYVGGLAASFRDERGFCWDLGGHVIFSQHARFHRVAAMMMSLPKKKRRAYVRLRDRWIPYPFQNNLGRLEPKDALACLLGLYQAQSASAAARNFRQWILATFGLGIAQLFLLPYNLKLWRTPLEDMDYRWTGERVSVVDFPRALTRYVLGNGDSSWGPNNFFLYPRHGGIGGFFRAFPSHFNKKIAFGKELSQVDVSAREIRFTGGGSDTFDTLISTIPLDRLASMLRPPRAELLRAARSLRRNGIMVVGVGLARPSRRRRSWMYFPEKVYPFYRVTNLSLYAKDNVPEGRTDRYCSLLCEISFAPDRPPSARQAAESVVQGLVRSGLMDESDRRRIASLWLRKVDYAYPVPTLGRDEALGTIARELERLGIVSRGRFGTWRYEVGNMDHSVIMGMDAVDSALRSECHSERRRRRRVSTPVQR